MTESVKLHPERFSRSNPINSQIYCRHKIDIAKSRNMEIGDQTKLGLLNPNPWSEISYQEFSNIFKTRPLIEKVYHDSCFFRFTNNTV